MTEMQLELLIGRLNDADVLSNPEASSLYRAATDGLIPKMLAGQTYGEAMQGLSILNQPEAEFRSELKSIDNDLNRQIEIVNESLDLWFGKGEIPPPYYPWRIAVILSKAKRKAEEQRFLTAWCRHFGDIRGGRYQALADRLRKLTVT
jgi:hypothetical protein